MNETEQPDTIKGPVSAHRHANGGGWVADTASVATTAYIGPNAQVSGNARVFGNAQVSGNETPAT